MFLTRTKHDMFANVETSLKETATPFAHLVLRLVAT